MLIIRRLNCIDAASGIGAPQVSGLDHSLVFRVKIPDAASIQFNLMMMRI